LRDRLTELAEEIEALAAHVAELNRAKLARLSRNHPRPR
jgi:hypothetical protein